MTEMINVKNLTVKFGNVIAVDDLTFHVDKGEIFGLLGPNGAGKTTTIRVLCCLIPPDDGTVKINNYDINKKDDNLNIRKIIGFVSDNTGFYETLSAYANLEFFGRMYESSEQLIKQNIEKYLRILDLWDKRDKVIGSFSKGMKQKVAIARALIHDPEILIMDEPTANLDPEVAKIIRDIIFDFKKEGKTVFLSTHNLDEAQRICDRIGILNTKLIAIDTPQNLEQMVSGEQTVIVLEEVNDDILNAVKTTGPKSIRTDEKRLVIEMNNPEKETPMMINAIVLAGGKIKSVNKIATSLEDVYLKLMKE